MDEADQSNGEVIGETGLVAGCLLFFLLLFFDRAGGFTLNLDWIGN